MSGLTTDQLNSISFLSGVNADGTLATTTGWRWNDNTPATYSNVGSAHKWGGGAAGG